MEPTRRNILLEVFAATGFVILLLVAHHGLGPISGGMSAALGIGASLAMLWLPVLALHVGRRDFNHYGLTLDDWRSGLRWALGAALIVLPLFVVGYWLFWGVGFGRELAWRLDRTTAWQALYQLSVVALSEEVFFRGFVQSSLAVVWPAKTRRWVGEHGPAILVTAVLFALAHALPTGQLLRLAVFFPALLLGWLRVRTGSILAPVVFHGLANLCVFILAGKV